ncbi:hypothetical protein [Metapseudomonas boanensis]|uniref:Uncharacterized protein n=1 Tax=Metapseudomonas boanensis TaxID=2822138 RepID=A0ABS5XGP4_9GAMM|nr:hypothetical protein [Pseudomonas boanensis]MBT8766863.1 hypothetical protein [Pseudomonas boanensis]
MDDKKRRSSGEGTGLSEKSLSPEEILERSLSLIAAAGTIRTLELEAHKTLGRIDALSLAGLIDRVRAKAWGQRVVHATAMAMLELEGRV